MANLVGQIKGYHSGAKTIANIYDAKQTSIGNASVLMHFDSTPIKDECGNTWTDYGTQKALCLDGSSYIQCGALPIGGQDFTIDFWFNVSENNTGGTSCFASFYINGNNRIHAGYLQNNDNRLEIFTPTGEIDNFFSQSGYKDGIFHHYAAVYVHSTATYYLFIDGVLQASKTQRQYAARNAPLYVGVNPFSGRKITGFIDEFRYSNGVVRWTANFTPPARGTLTKDANTVVLLKFDSSATVDECGNTWTATGTPIVTATSITVAQAKFGKALYLNGSTYLQMAQPIVIGGQDFTIDFWGYISSATGWYGYLFSEPDDKTGINRVGNNNYAHAVFNSTECHTNITLNAWHHFALVYEHGKSIGKIYLDGKAGNKYYSGTFPATSKKFSLGAGYADGQYRGTCYVDEFRIVIGKAMWTADFTPPTSAYTTTTGASTVNANMMIRHNNANCYIPLTTNTAHTTAPYIAIRHGNANYYTVK